MRSDIYKLFRLADLTEDLSYLDRIEMLTGLDYRTVRYLYQMISDEPDVPMSIFDKLSDPDYYTYENCLKLHRLGLSGLIPYYFYESDRFLTAAGIDSLPDRFLSDCKNIETFRVSPLIRKIGAAAFADSSITDLVFDDPETSHIEIVGANAFARCKELSGISFPHLSYVADHAFADSSIFSFICPSSRLNISSYAFSGCHRLAVFRGPDTVRLSVGSFNDCQKLSVFDCNVSSLGQETFNGCINLHTLSLSAPIIYTDTFVGCTGLTSIVFHKNPILIQDGAFDDCKHLSEIRSYGYRSELCHVPGYVNLLEGIRYNKETKRLNRDFYYSKDISDFAYRI